MNLRYALDALRRNLTNRHWYATVFNSNVGGPLHKAIRGNEGEYVLEQDWDNLLILDGCRYDLFEAVYREEGFEDRLPGELHTARSRGTGTPEYLRENFGGQILDDVVYVTANPFVAKVLDDPFHHVEHVWQSHWDEATETVMPADIVSRAVATYERFPDKRLIVHFMQPHHPFIGDVRLDEDRGFVGARAKSLDESVPDVDFVWEHLRRGLVSKEEVWEAYRSNLVFVLEHVVDLVGRIPGKHVVTSDHGNAFGERFLPFPTRVYGHGNNLRIDPLVKVPWIELHVEDRRKITADSATDVDATGTDEDIDERLEALGYKV